MAMKQTDAFEELLREAVHDSSVLPPGATLLDGRLEVRRLLGQGGMGVVYEVFDRDVQEAIALKTLSAADAGALYRFKQEFRALADTDHPNLVRLHEMFTDHGQWFFTMDLVEGVDFLTAVADGASESNGTLRGILSQLAAALAALHSGGLLHRDIKPSNVLVRPDGQVVVLDFGLVEDLSPKNKPELPNAVGTPVYMAPELGMGQAATEPSDWYGVGVMLYEALTSRLPLMGTSASVIAKKLAEAPPAPLDVTPGVDKDLSDLAMLLLERDPEKRAGYSQVVAVVGEAQTDAAEVNSTNDDQDLFVGRVAELERLRQAFDRCERAGPVVSLVSGISGVGKTALVERFLDEVSPRAVVLAGRCYEQETVPYKACDVLIDSLSRYLRSLPPSTARALLPEQMWALVSVFPVLERLDVLREVCSRSNLPDDPTELRTRGFGVLKELLARIAVRQPLVLFIDDLQWADVDGAWLLGSLLTPPAPPHMLLLGAYRRDEVDRSPGLMQLLSLTSELETLEISTLDLAELDLDEALDLARGLLPESRRGDAERVVAEAEGSPYFITEVARHFSSSGGAVVSVDVTITDRLAALEREERQVLEAICVSGRPVGQSLLGQIVEPKAAARSLRRLLAGRWIRPTGQQRGLVTSFHDRTSAAVVDVMGDRIVAWHRELARVLEGWDEPDLAALTRHYLGSGQIARAAKSAVGAAEAAERTLAFDAAADLYRVALDHGAEGGNHRLEVTLAEVLAKAGRSAESGRAYLRAARTAANQDDELDLRRQGAEQLLLGGHVTEGFAVLRQALVDRGDDFDAILNADPTTLFAGIIERGVDFEPVNEQDIDPVKLRWLDTLWSIALGLSYLRANVSQVCTAQYFREAVEVGEPSRVARGLWFVAGFESMIQPERLHVLPVYERLSSQLGARLAQANLALCRGNIALFSCQPQRLLDSCSEAAEMYEKIGGLPRELSMARHLVLVAHNDLGQLRAVFDKSMEWIDRAKKTDDLHLLTWLRVHLSHYYIAADMPEAARRSLDKVTADWPDEVPEVTVYIHRCRALCDAYENKPSGWEQHEMAHEVYGRSLFPAMPVQRGFEAHNRGLVALALAHLHPNRKLLLSAAEEAAAELESPHSIDGRLLDLPAWKPQAKLLQAGLAATRGQPTEAARALDEALALFESEDSSRAGRACALRRKGQLLGGDEGRALVCAADRELEALGMVDVERYCDLYAPGFAGVLGSIGEGIDQL